MQIDMGDNSLHMSVLLKLVVFFRFHIERPEAMEMEVVKRTFTSVFHFNLK